MKKKYKTKVNDALKEILQEKSMDEIAVRDITDRIGYTPQGFYYHCRNLKEYFDLWMQMIFRDAAKLKAADSWLDEAEGIMRLFREDREILNAVMASGYRHSLEDSLYRCAGEFAGHWMEGSEGSGEKEKKLRISLLQGDLYGLLLTDLHLNLEYDMEDIVRNYCYFHDTGRKVS